MNTAHDWTDDPRLTAYALGELSGDEHAADRAALEARLAVDAGLREAVAQIRDLAAELARDLVAEPALAAPVAGLTAAQHRAIENALPRAAQPGSTVAAGAAHVALTSDEAQATDAASAAETAGAAGSATPPRGWLYRLRFVPALAAGLLVAVMVWQASDRVARVPPELAARNSVRETVAIPAGEPFLYDDFGGRAKKTMAPTPEQAPVSGAVASAPSAAPAPLPADAAARMFKQAEAGAAASVQDGIALRREQHVQPADAEHLGQLLSLGYMSETAPAATPAAAASGGAQALAAAPPREQSPVIYTLAGSDADALALRFGLDGRHGRGDEHGWRYFRTEPGTESYQPIVEQGFVSPFTQPLSTFSIDVDTASYANVRRFLNAGQLPPADAVRLEEFINYFRYDYPQPDGADPFSVNVDVAGCPWAPAHRLVRIGLQGRSVPQAERAPSNLVFLVDVSGSMNSPDKLPLVIASLKLLVGRLDARDRIALVVYAGSAGLVLPSTSCAEKQPVLDALERLSAGGSTAGGAGIALAYQVAAQNFIKGGTNRVILATDGDFNVGATSRDELQALIERSAKSGVFLTVLGFGTGNLKDGTAELLADKGNGNYAYIDSLAEAQKVLVQQMGGTLIAIAKDVKLQVEFNPGRVGAYRLLGYENRALAAQDFNDDRKDAGEIGAGHSVTALYEVVPAGVAVAGVPAVDPLRYQSGAAAAAGAPASAQAAQDAALAALVPSPELLNVKLRYKQPDGDVSKLLEQPVTDGEGSLAQAPADFRFAAAVASFAMLLRGSGHAGDASFDSVLALAEGACGTDADGYRAEFVRLVRLAQSLGSSGPR